MPTLLERMSSYIESYVKNGLSVREASGLNVGNFQTIIGNGAFGIPSDKGNSEGMKAYKKSPWVYAGVSAIVNDASSHRMKLRRRKITKEGIEYEEIYEHQALDILEFPQPTDDGRSYLNGTILRQLKYLHLILCGEAIWALDNYVMGVPTEIHPLIPEFVSPRTDKNTGRILEYVYRFGAASIHFDPKQIVHFKLVDPLNFYRGQSALLAASTAINTDNEADSFLYNYFVNRALPDAVLMREKKPDVEDVARMKEMWQQLYGGGKNAGKIAMLWGGMDLKTLSVNQRDMQFKEMKEFNRDVIMADLRVGKGIIGMMEDQSRANAEAQDYVFAKRVVKPFLDSVSSQATTDLLPLFAGSEDMEYYYDNIVPDDLVSKATVFGSLIGNGIVTINEARKEFNLDARDEPDADKLMAPISRAALPTQAELDAEDAAAAEAAKNPPPPPVPPDPNAPPKKEDPNAPPADEPNPDNAKA